MAQRLEAAVRTRLARYLAFQGTRNIHADWSAGKGFAHLDCCCSEFPKTPLSTRNGTRFAAYPKPEQNVRIMPINKPLRILHLEDEPDFADLVRSLLEKDGLKADLTLVATREDFEKALST